LTWRNADTGNIVADLGFDPLEAENLKLRSQLMSELRRIIADMPQSSQASVI
jgi:predicted XRE-type DNA-binding protein